MVFTFKAKRCQLLLLRPVHLLPLRVLSLLQSKDRLDRCLLKGGWYVVVLVEILRPVSMTVSLFV